MAKNLLLISFLTVLILAGCSSPSAEYTLGSVILAEPFDNIKAWEFYEDAEENIRLEVLDGVYQVQAGDIGYIWGLNDQEHSNVVMEVSANQLSAFEDNAYGVMCRADTSNNGDGYYFLISGDGYYSIAKGEGDDVNSIVDWTSSSAINKGTGKNTIRAVCIGDYLSLYVNDKFMADARDGTFASGYAGFVANANTGGDVTVSFDDLTIWEATLSTE